MEKSFKIGMFFTSFLPLWVSIAIIYACNINSYMPDDCFKQTSLKEIISTILNEGCVEKVVIILFAVVILIIIGYCMYSFFWFRKFIKEKSSSNNSSKAKILEAKNINNLSSEFLLAYILPMATFDFFKVQDIFLFSIYFCVLGFLCVRNNNIYVNILLEFNKYKLYDCNINCIVAGDNVQRNNILLISKVDVRQPIYHELKYYDFENDIYINLEE